MTEWCPCSVRPMLMASGCGRILVRGCALFVVFVVLYWHCLRLLSFVGEVLVTDPGVPGGALV